MCIWCLLVTVWMLEENVGHLPLVLIALKQGYLLNKNLAHLARLAILFKKLLGSVRLPLLPMLVLEVYIALSDFLHWCWRFKLRFFCIHSKCSN